MHARRAFLLGAGATATATALGTVDAAAAPGTSAAPSAAHTDFTDGRGRVDWRAVRREFRLDPSWTQLSLFALASLPRTVRDAIAHLAAQLDANPLSVTTGLSLPDGATGWDRVRSSLASYLGGRPDELALTLNTSTGLGHVYHGIKVKPGQEFLLTDQEHNAHLGAAILAGEKHGVSFRQVKLFDAPATASVDEMAGRLRAGITARTRVVGVTWVQSSTGVRLPVRELADVVAEANSGRAEEDRCLLVVDGVHGLGAVDTGIDELGADFFVAGTHKWLSGPRGTALIHSPSRSWGQVRPTVAPWFREDSIANMTPGLYQAFENMFALPAAVAFQQSIGRGLIAERIADLSDRVKDGLADIPGVTVHTPRDRALSAGINCFEISGVDGEKAVAALQANRIGITTAPYAKPYLRIGTAPVNFPEEIDRGLRALRRIARA